MEPSIGRGIWKKRSLFTMARKHLKDEPQKIEQLKTILDKLYEDVMRVGVEASESMRELFDGRPDIIEGLNQFMPDVMFIKNSDPQYAFISKVEARFRENPIVMQSFNKLMDDYTLERRPDDDIEKEMIDLFQGHTDMQTEFKSNFMDHKWGAGYDDYPPPAP